MSTGLKQNFIGAFSTSSDLPEALGSSNTYPRLSVGQQAYVVGTSTMWLCTDATLSNAVWVEQAGGSFRSSNKIVVGIASSGDTSADCTFLDGGFGDGLQSALSFVATLLTYGTTGVDIYIRPGTIDMSGNGQSNIILPKQTTIRGAGKACTFIQVPYDSGFLSMDVNGSCLLDLTVEVTASSSINPVVATGFVSLVDTLTPAAKVSPFQVKDVDFRLLDFVPYAAAGGACPRHIFSMNVDLMTATFAPYGNVFENVNVVMGPFTPVNSAVLEDNCTAFHMYAGRAAHIATNIQVNFANCHALNTENGFVGDAAAVQLVGCSYNGVAMETWPSAPTYQVGMMASLSSVNSAASSCEVVTAVTSATGYLIYSETSPDSALTAQIGLANCSYRHGGTSLPQAGIGFHMRGETGFVGSGVRLTGCIAQNAATGFENALEFEYTQCVGGVTSNCTTPVTDASPNSDFTGVLSF